MPYFSRRNRHVKSMSTRQEEDRLSGIQRRSSSFTEHTIKAESDRVKKAAAAKRKKRAAAKRRRRMDYYGGMAPPGTTM